MSTKLFLNKVTLCGVVTKKPEYKVGGKGADFVIFTLLTQKTYLSRAGQNVTTDTWHNIIAFGRNCDMLKNSVNKDDRIYIEGEISVSSYEKEGVKHTSTSINLSSFVVIESASTSPSFGLSPSVYKKTDNAVVVTENQSKVNESIERIKEAERMQTTKNDIPFFVDKPSEGKPSNLFTYSDDDIPF